jgi:hypothetical protein
VKTPATVAAAAPGNHPPIPALAVPLLSLADGIHAKTGLRKEDIWISLVSVEREDLSFCNGEMQYAPK